MALASPFLNLTRVVHALWDPAGHAGKYDLMDAFVPKRFAICFDAGIPGGRYLRRLKCPKADP